MSLWFPDASQSDTAFWTGSCGRGDVKFWNPCGLGKNYKAPKTGEVMDAFLHPTSGTVRGIWLFDRQALVQLDGIFDKASKEFEEIRKKEIEQELRKRKKELDLEQASLGVTVDARVGNTFLVRSLRLFER